MARPTSKIKVLFLSVLGLLKQYSLLTLQHHVVFKPVQQLVIIRGPMLPQQCVWIKSSLQKTIILELLEFVLYILASFPAPPRFAELDFATEGERMSADTTIKSSARVAFLHPTRGFFAEK
jgi:hypothetical protein